ncbi:hypothetical protein SAMN06265377_1099 [Flagellimonas pacifica]|uniref:Uncharacterized protein n=1 Tax=Flagellimonas pacifica TaxID=1247520 RepID=A0A285ME37_9FLAO|nr:hypothetical protein SAMN06265377_1099 [Allomuricauda parva]
MRDVKDRLGKCFEIWMKLIVFNVLDTFALRRLVRVYLQY